MTTFDEARRYVELARSGWTDPGVDVNTLIEELCDAHDAWRGEHYTLEEHDEAIEAVEANLKETLYDEDEVEEIRDEVRKECAPENLGVGELLVALEAAIKRERDEAGRARVAWLEAEVARLTKERDDLRVMESAHRKVLESRASAVEEPKRTRKPNEPKGDQRVRKPKAPIVLPKRGARLTKKSCAAMVKFQEAVGALILEREGVCVYDGGPDDNELLGYRPRRYEMETPVGRWTLSPAGNALYTCFDEPARAVKVVGDWNLNTYSGKFNFYYSGQKLDDALDAVRAILDRMLDAATSTEVAS